MNNHIHMIRNKYLVCWIILCCLHFSQNICFSAEEEKEVEEGWRYTSALSLKVEFEGNSEKFDLQPYATSMAYTQRNAVPLAEDFDLANDKVFSLLRFTPVIADPDGGMRLGNTVILPSALADENIVSPYVPTPYQETVFVSGFCDREKKKLVVLRNSVSVFDPAETNKNMFAMFAPFNPSKLPAANQLAKYNLAVRFLQRSYVAPALFENRLMFRYPDSPIGTVFEPGNYEPIKSIHDKTKKLIDDRKVLVAADFDNIKARALKMDIVEAIDEFGDLKKGRSKFHTVAGANSYSCAEQTVLDYISDVRVYEYLQTSLHITDNLTKGVIIHIHCSQTPCGTCSTSFARECEAGGIFSKISNGKPIKIICTCSQHYPRKRPGVLYDSTRWLQGLADKEIVFNMNDGQPLSANLPYSVALLTLNLDTGKFDIHEEEYQRFLKAAAGAKKEVQV
ncbi:MAG: hypothetical protein WCG04_05630 [Alphaproteobacteria bacterium]